MVKCKFIYKQYDNSSYAIQEAFKGLNFTWDDESTTLIKPKFFCNLFQQNLEQRVAKVACGNDKPTKLRPNIDG